MNFLKSASSFLNHPSYMYLTECNIRHYINGNIGLFGMKKLKIKWGKFVLEAEHIPPVTFLVVGLLLLAAITGYLSLLDGLDLPFGSHISK